ncbi:MAG: 3-dehydroquinate synthase [Leptolyngbyaceae cyanobacterium T60_A2020_046]|nr:3-dehydroquinate synthase [Leptolyngbyaceae cyanobacterium T60_A2020_046]
MKSVISVPLPHQPYNVVIASGVLDELGAGLAEHTPPLIKPSQRLVLVSNPDVFGPYGDRAIVALENAGYTVTPCLLPEGEQHKTLASVQIIYDAALAAGLERGSAMVALGGGVIGDMTGFAAATWLRGIAFVQVPTTLLAMVDASIGGKTGVNHPQGKNLIGAFHQPKQVFIDPQVLHTLPDREFRAGMAEVIKYGVIWDAALFERLEAAERLDDIRHVSADLLQEILTRSCQAKADVVSKDEKEAGLRAILNYGHTIGHAIESLMHYQGVNHGEAVGIGMVAAGEIAVRMGWWEPSAAARQLALLQKTGLPIQIPAGCDTDAIIDALKTDKKVEDGCIRFVLPTQIGVAKVTNEPSPALVREVVAALTAA